MNSPAAPSSEDWLDDLLREEAAYIDDAGFSQRVVAQLPHPSRAQSRLRRTIFALAAMCSTMIAIFTLPSLVNAAHGLRFPSISAVISHNSLLMALASLAAIFISSSLIWVSREK